MEQSSVDAAPPPLGTASLSAGFAQPSRKVDWKDGYTTRDPYPLAIALREAKEKGSFAASKEIVGACIQALIAIGGPPNRHSSTQDAQDPQLQARLQAKQEIEVRCSRFSGQDVHSLNFPLPGDHYGERFQQALAALNDGAGMKREIEALMEVVGQGVVPSRAMLSTVIEARTWRGESWRDRREDFDTALNLAIRLATTSPTEGGSDIRDLTSCYFGARCGSGGLRTGLQYFPADRRVAVEALVVDMQKALQSGDLEPFLQVKK
jgi:hypothetical protein